MLISSSGDAEWWAAVGGAWRQRYGQLHGDVSGRAASADHVV